MASSWWSSVSWKQCDKTEAGWLAAEADWTGKIGSARMDARRSRRVDALTESFGGFFTEQQPDEEPGTRIYNRRLPVAVPPFAALHGELKRMAEGELIDSFTFQPVKVSRSALSRDIQRIDTSRIQKTAEAAVEQRRTPLRKGLQSANATTEIRRRPSSRIVDPHQGLDIRPTSLQRQFSTGSLFQKEKQASPPILMPRRRGSAEVITPQAKPVQHLLRTETDKNCTSSLEKVAFSTTVNTTDIAVTFSTPSTKTKLPSSQRSASIHLPSRNQSTQDPRPKSLRRPSAPAAALVT